MVDEDNAAMRRTPAPEEIPMSSELRQLCVLYSAVALVAPLAWVISTLLSGCERVEGCENLWEEKEGVAASVPIVVSRVPWIAATGAATGALHSLASLGTRAGNQTLYASWVVYYLARPFTGAGVAIVTYLLLVSGIGGFTVTGSVPQLGWAALAGLYSEQALIKFRDVFRVLMQSPDDSGNKPGPPKPSPDPAAPRPNSVPPANTAPPTTTAPGQPVSVEVPPSSQAAEQGSAGVGGSTTQATDQEAEKT
jgi:hypothetical protein